MQGLIFTAVFLALVLIAETKNPGGMKQPRGGRQERPLTEAHTHNEFFHKMHHGMKCKLFHSPLVCELRNKTSQEVVFSQPCMTSQNSPFSECATLDEENKTPHHGKHKGCPFYDKMDVKVCKPKVCKSDLECGTDSKCVEKPQKGDEENQKYCEVTCPWKLAHMACKVVNGTSVSTRLCPKSNEICQENVTENVTLNGHQLSLSFYQPDNHHHVNDGSMMDMCESCEAHHKPDFHKPKKLDENTVICGVVNKTTGVGCEESCNQDLFPYYGDCSPLEGTENLKSCPMMEIDCQEDSDCQETTECIHGKCRPTCEVLLFQQACFRYNETSQEEVFKTCNMSDFVCNHEETETVELGGHQITLAFYKHSRESSSSRKTIPNASKLGKCLFMKKLARKFGQHKLLKPAMAQPFDETLRHEEALRRSKEPSGKPGRAGNHTGQYQPLKKGQPMPVTENGGEQQDPPSPGGHPPSGGRQSGGRQSGGRPQPGGRWHQRNGGSRGNRG